METGTLVIDNDRIAASPSYTFHILPSIEEIKLWEEYKSTSILSIPNEPKSYKMEDTFLLELNEEDWKNIWKEHIQFRDTQLKKMNFDNYKGRLYGSEPAHTSHYIDSIHLNFKLIKLERRLQKLES